MSRYKKGANAERQLIRVLYERGFAVVRAAGSGTTPLPAPDLVALSKEKRIAFECKAWKGNYLNIPAGQVQELKEWSRRAGAEPYIAWKATGRGWFFLTLGMLTKNEKNHSITLENARKKAVDLGVVLGQQA